MCCASYFNNISLSVVLSAKAVVEVCKHNGSPNSVSSSGLTLTPVSIANDSSFYAVVNKVLSDKLINTNSEPMSVSIESRVCCAEWASILKLILMWYLISLPYLR